MHIGAPHILAAVAAAMLIPQSLAAQPACMPMALGEAGPEAPPAQYREFCDAEPEACRLDGAATMEWTASLFDTLMAVNLAVNTENVVVSDLERTGRMDVWNFPTDCTADCEDFALAKRERLVALGLPRAALTMATALHQTELFPHAVLLAETTEGTWLLDNLYDEVLCWDAAPYLFVTRERPDGLWTRFQLP
jgi:predicted transglutaminase-like cysteine proteinase